MGEHNLFINLFFHDLFFPSMHLSVFIILCLKETSEGSLAKDTFGGRFVTFQTGDSVYIDPNEKIPDSSIYFVFLQAYSRFHRRAPGSCKLLRAKRT